MNDEKLPIHLADIRPAVMVLYCGLDFGAAPYYTTEIERATCRECLKKRAAQDKNL